VPTASGAAQAGTPCRRCIDERGLTRTGAFGGTAAPEQTRRRISTRRITWLCGRRRRPDAGQATVRQ